MRLGMSEGSDLDLVVVGINKPKFYRTHSGGVDHIALENKFFFG